MYDIIIVGGGTAGLSAAIYGVRAGRRVLILEAKNYGGQIINSPEVENYPGIRKISGMEFAKGLYEQATGLGAEFRQGQVLRVEVREKDRAVLSPGRTAVRRNIRQRRLFLPQGRETVLLAWRGNRSSPEPVSPTVPPVMACFSADGR